MFRRGALSDLLKEYGESTGKKGLYVQISKMRFLSLIVTVGVIYFDNMFFGQYSLDTMLSLESMKRESNGQILLLKEQNTKAQKEYFELQGLNSDEEK